jgi:hypothetical protein
MSNTLNSETTFQGNLLNIIDINEGNTFNLNYSVENLTRGINFNSISQITLNQPSEAMQRIKNDNESSTTTTTKPILST